MAFKGRIFWWLAIAVVTSMGASTVSAAEEDILVYPGDVTMFQESDTTRGTAYTLSYALPAGLTTVSLGRAIMELHVDVGVKPRGEFESPAPLFEVYALKQPILGVFDPERLKSAGRVHRPVALGASRRVVLDVTEIVRAHLEARLVNNGMAVGSLTGERDGEFTFRSGMLPGGAIGRIVLLPRGERMLP
ncbi:MAG TPA: hypothetical protein VFX92_11360 [Candidatus Krumholzibacteria bacterium]|nr:hypothetical protein [Candidatus Krumholzibacteria bacterium]